MRNIETHLWYIQNIFRLIGNLYILLWCFIICQCEKKNVDVTDKTMKSVSKVSTYRSPPSLGWLTECVYHRLLWICSTCHKHFPVLSSFMITGFVTRVTRCVPLFCWSLFFVWPLCSLFFDLRILITPLALVSSNLLIIIIAAPSTGLFTTLAIISVLIFNNAVILFLLVIFFPLFISPSDNLSIKNLW